MREMAGNCLAKELGKIHQAAPMQGLGGEHGP